MVFCTVSMRDFPEVTDVVSEEVLLVNECYWQVEILAAVSRRGGVGGRSSRRILEEDQNYRKDRLEKAESRAERPEAERLTPR